MIYIAKHWRSLKEAYLELAGWERKWENWYYPYSMCILIVRYMIASLAGILVFILLKAILI